MTIKQFIKKAIEGGWKDLGLSFGDKKDLRIYFDPAMALVEVSFKDEREVTFKRSISGLFLDPKAWQAVGKVEGWDEDVSKRDEEDFESVRRYSTDIHYFSHGTSHAYNEEWRYKMHQMIDALAEGKSIEDYIATL